MRRLVVVAVAICGCKDAGSRTSTPVTSRLDDAAVRADAAIPPPPADAGIPPNLPADATPSAPVDVTLALAPVCATGSDVPSALAVALTVPLTGRPRFRIDDNVLGSAGTAATITDAVAQDATGPLAIVRRVRDGVLELTPSRDAVGHVTLRYRVRAIATTDDGPRDGLRHDATGIGGHGRHILVLPESRKRYRTRVTWTAPECPATTRGAGTSSFDGGDTAGELAGLREAAYYYGRPQRTATDDGSLHLRTAWFGEPALDVAATGAWTARVFAAERAFFADDEPDIYSIFVRVVTAQTDRSNGIAHEHGFLSTIGPRTTFARRIKINIAHEMLHRWLGMRLRLRGTEGTAYWFTEGFTVHLANRLAFRAGLLSVDEYLEELDNIATRHFDNPRAGASNDQIRRDFNRDPNVAVVPYTRGALYAAELDAAIRRASHGKRTFDDLVRELYATSRTQRVELPVDALRALVHRELGRAGTARYDAVIVRGGHPQPPTDAYGPCFAQARRATGFTWTRVTGIADDACRAW